jgi:hypothetical protein
MAFINELISEADLEKYHIKEIDEEFVVGQTKSRQWTIDRGRDIYLRNVARGGGGDPDIRSQTTWTLYWHGDLLGLRLDLLDGGGARGEPGWSHWRLVWLEGSHGLPDQLKPQRTQILEALYEALLAYKDFGVYSTNTDYRVTLDLAEGCVV